jgi:hypothetical protein
MAGKKSRQKITHEISIVFCVRECAHFKALEKWLSRISQALRDKPMFRCALRYRLKITALALSPANPLRTFFDLKGYSGSNPV